jgi:hypothetical protein
LLPRAGQKVSKGFSSRETANFTCGAAATPAFSAKTTTGSHMNENVPERNHAAIRERAHKLWEAGGKPQGWDDYFWLEAERQLREEQSLGNSNARQSK